MPSDILVEEFHLSLFVRTSLAAAKQDAIAHTLTRPAIRAKLRHAVRAVLRKSLTQRKDQLCP